MEFVKYEQKGFVGIVTIDRPKALNALNSQVLGELEATFDAIDLENKGNEFLAQGQYESAVTYYRTAQAIYIRLELAELADGLNAKIEAAQAGIEAEAAARAEEARANNQEENPPGPAGDAP